MKKIWSAKDIADSITLSAVSGPDSPEFGYSIMRADPPEFSATGHIHIRDDRNDSFCMSVAALCGNTWYRKEMVFYGIGRPLSIEEVNLIASGQVWGLDDYDDGDIDHVCKTCLHILNTPEILIKRLLQDKLDKGRKG